MAMAEEAAAPTVPEAAAGREPQRRSTTVRWKRFLKGSKKDTESDSVEGFNGYRERWTLGILNDKETDEVPGKWKLARILLRRNSIREHQLVFSIYGSRYHTLLLRL